MISVPKLPPPTISLSELRPQFVTFKPESESSFFRIYKSHRDPLEFRYVCVNHRFDHHDYCWFRKSGNIITISKNRGVYYAAPVYGLKEEQRRDAISCCLAECFGDSREIEAINERKICCIKVINELKFLDLRGDAAMQAGMTAGIGADSNRETTQSWSRFIYENTNVYGNIDGLIYSSRNNAKDSVVIYERASSKLELATAMSLTHPKIRPLIEEISEKLLIRIAPNQNLNYS
jgi:RES domain